MKLIFPNAKFTRQEDRQRLANRLARIIAASDGIDFEPYKVVPFDSMAWVLDQHNDWRLNFFIDDDTTAEIRYRYQGSGVDHEGALAAWLCHAIGVTAAPQTAASGPASPTSPQACPACGSDCNESDELIKAEREIERLKEELRFLREQPGAEPVAWQCRVKEERQWRWCSEEHFKMVLGNPGEWPWYEVRQLYAEPQPAQQAGVDSSVMVEALNAWASDLERGMQVCIAASSLRKIAVALAAPQPARQPETEAHGHPRHALDEWIEKTDWVQKTATPAELGMHRADVLAKRLADATSALASAHCGYQAKLLDLESKIQSQQGSTVKITHDVMGTDTAPQPAQQQVEPVAGWKLVPIEPTPVMVDAGTDGGDAWINENRVRAVYKAMIAAAPQPAQQPAQEPVAEVESTVHGAGGFHCRLLASTMPPVGAKLYTTPTDAEALRALIADDGYAMTFQSMGQYRTALLRALAHKQEPTDDIRKHQVAT